MTATLDSMLAYTGYSPVPQRRRRSKS